MDQHIIHKNSNSAYSGTPYPETLEYGELAINYGTGNEGIFLKNSEDQVIRIGTDSRLQDDILGLKKKQNVASRNIRLLNQKHVQNIKNLGIIRNNLITTQTTLDTVESNLGTHILYHTGNNEFTTLENLPVTKKFIYVELDTDSTLSFSGELEAGQEISLYVRAMDKVTVTIPNTPAFKTLGGIETYTFKAFTITEINVCCCGGISFVEVTDQKFRYPVWKFSGETSSSNPYSVKLNGNASVISIGSGDIYEFATVPTSCNSMFYNCTGLTNLDLSNFDTSAVTDMNGMFYKCSSLTSLDLSNFDTSAVTNMSSMFRSCSGLTSLDLSNFDTSAVTNMSGMFIGCSSLRYITLGPNFFKATQTIPFSGASNLGLNTDNSTSNGWLEHLSQVAPQITDGQSRTIQLHSNLKDKSWAEEYLQFLRDKGYTIA